VKISCPWGRRGSTAILVFGSTLQPIGVTEEHSLMQHFGIWCHTACPCEYSAAVRTDMTIVTITKGDRRALRVIAQALPLRTLRTMEMRARGAERMGQRGKASQDAIQDRKPLGRHDEL
jgi:hypothetical protein